MDNLTTNKSILDWVADRVALLSPDKVVWIDGSREQIEALKAEAVSTGEFIKLNEEKLPDCYLHRTDPSDVARVEGRTFICTPTREETGPLNNWMAPDETYELLDGIIKDSYKGKTMYVIPYSMGPVGSPFSKYGLEVTDSIYVVCNMDIMTRIGQPVLDAIGSSEDWIKGTHASCDCDPEKRYICQFPQDNTIYSVCSCYGGNVLQGKKCFALRIASYLGLHESWQAEHMLILGLEYPNGDIKYLCAAFPSACGKTNLAMLVPPEVYRKKGYKLWTVGDDIAWIRKGPDGRMYALNPEYGFFGVAPGTNEKSNPNALAATREGTIFTNVALNLDDNTIWWEGLDNAPENGLDWQGQPWNGKTSTEKGAYPNSRFTAPSRNCPCLSSEYENPDGVPVEAFVFGGRRAKLAPLVYQARDWNHGVFIGSSMASETTAAATGAVGVVRRDPMAMRPFIGYDCGTYFQHWLDIGKTVDVDKQPKFFNVNWFRKDDEGHFMWPGFGDNLRVLDWILKRCAGEVDAVETEIGFLPKPEDINLEGLEDEVSMDALKEMLSVDKKLWAEEAEGIEEFYDSLGSTVPAELKDQLAKLKAAVAE
ncbi:MAG: phosphoenolpyruvate carboxykinase (GTP) [Clostridia bacterium]|nr:phosphoenolpyruvate carboxykinase (GTP) [Clostridia bacterium]